MPNKISINRENMDRMFMTSSPRSDGDNEEDEIIKMRKSRLDSEINEENKINQWVSSIQGVRSNVNESLNFLNEILGPIKLEDLNYYLNHEPKSQDDEANDAHHQSSKGATKNHKDRITEIIFKIDEKVFIEEINIYMRVVSDSHIVQIDALNVKTKTSKKGILVNSANSSLNEEWIILWKNEDSKNEQSNPSKPCIFSPKILPKLFKTDTLRFTISGKLNLINAIEIKGNKYAMDDEQLINDLMVNNKQTLNGEYQNQRDDLNEYSSFAKQLHDLIMDDLFADIYLEVEGKIIPAHKNILVSRSDYFRAMIGDTSKFKESQSINHSKNNPIYIKDISYCIFKEILNYLYTGHINHLKMTFYDILNLMRASDRMNLIELEQLALYHINQILTKENVVKIYMEASETPELMTHVIEMCYNIIINNFEYVSKLEDFCSLSQELMLKIIQTVLPRINRNGKHKTEKAIKLRSELSDSDSDESD